LLFKELLAWIDRQEVTLDEITTKQWKYARAIKQEITLMEQAHEADDIPKQKHHMTRAQGYFKKAQSLIKEGKV
jgi:hypothetical protein